jgi:Tfp pilus assembly protein PilF
VRSIVPALTCLILAACASPAPAPAPEPLTPSSLFLDSAFQPRAVPADPQVFAMSDAMRRYLADIGPDLRIQGHLRGLVSALESNTHLKLEYDSAVTRTAAEAFDARAGNCLSLTLMTAALARELGVSVSFHRVHSDPLWTRVGDTLFSNGHVNILLGAAMLPERGVRGVRGVIIDFTPSADIRAQRSQQISEATVVAMYMNNRAAETMRAGSLDDAYWWARGAIARDPSFLEAINTLGVVYSHRGRLAQAERVFRYVLAIESDNVSALANLAGAVERQGRKAEAAVLSAQLKKIEAQPPFHFFDLGMEALRAKDYAAARTHFQSELRRNAYYHEAHFGLAVAYLGLGESRIARQHLAIALEHSTSRDEQNIYSAKLAWLRAHRPE